MKLKIIIILILTLNLHGEAYRDSPYIDNKNGTVTDKETKLVWQKCSIGQKNNYLCSGEATFHDWDDAQNQCKSLKLGNKKWRLPKLEELNSLLVDIHPFKLKLDLSSFPNSSTEYWTSSSINANIFNYWYINFDLGNILKKENETLNLNVRCVSGDVYSSLIESSNGTITDKKTGLVWQKCSFGQKNSRNCSGDPIQLSWENAVKKCSLLKLEGRKWRLPTDMEFIIINQHVDISSFFPISSQYSRNNFWSSSNQEGEKNSAYAVYSNSADGNYYEKSNEFYIRCVSNK